MTGMLVAGASSVAHGVHYIVLGVGLLGLAALLAPILTTGRRQQRVDVHAVRVAALRRSLGVDTLEPVRVTSTLTDRPWSGERPAEEPQLWLPLAIVGTAAAAGVHAAVGPAHFRAQAVLGAFFALVALAQMVWSFLAVLSPSDRLLKAGILANAALIALWLVTRTTGLPGLAPEPVGPWDLASVGWESIAGLACLRAVVDASHVRGDVRGDLAALARWDVRAVLWLVVSVMGLGLLSIAGA